MSVAGHTKLDNRIRTLIENGVATGHRSMFAIVGDKARDQIMVLHHILSKSSVSARPSVLWCYKKDLGFSSNRKKRLRDMKVKEHMGNTFSKDNPMDVFLSTTTIRYCYYNETQNILGNTYGMVILQDFEALTPNLLARTIETVEGGGLIVFLMRSVNSLRQMYTLAMDVHNRYRTSSSGEVVARFNERFILSLASCQSCVVLDDALNVLPISSHISKIQPLPPSTKKEITPQEQELKTLKESMRDTKPIGPLLNKCRTLCQGKALLRLLDVLTDKSLNATCSITAARGRGKSAALGLSLSAAIAFGYTNVFVTSPSPENLKTLFQFVVKGFEALEWQEHIDYELIQSTNPEFNKAIVRINITREHRQVIQYVHPTDSGKLGQAELVVIDEAAAIPLPLVKSLIDGPYLVFLASTINGYEGTGRSLSLKLLQSLRQQSVGAGGADKIASKGRSLHEMTLEESIRYKPGDPIESWLNKVLCLDAPSGATKLSCGTPSPRDCQLYYVNRDTLFSFHKASESFLHQVMSIYVSAHYKNTPNDLQMLSDAPSHHLFVLMAPVAQDQTSLPQVLAVIQVCLEGNIARADVNSSIQQNKLPAGDLLPWTISQQFQDSEFPTLCGGRIVRIAVHPDYQNMGYGGRSLQLLEEYFLGRVPCLEEKSVSKKGSVKTVKESALGLLDEQIAPRSDLPPLLQRLNERRAEKLDYLGVSFGLTLPLLKFWKRAKYVPIYLRQSANDITGEYTCIVLKEMRDLDAVEESDIAPSWLAGYWNEFRSRMMQLFSFEFTKFSAQLAHSMLNVPGGAVETKERKVLTRAELSIWLSDSALGRLSRYAKNMLDHQIVTDLLPTLGKLYFENSLPLESKLSAVQAVLLVGLGLQHKTVDEMAKELNMPANQILAVYNKTVRKLCDGFDLICEGAVRRILDGDKVVENDDTAIGDAVQHMIPLAQSLEDDLNQAVVDIKKRQERDKKTMLGEIDKSLEKYAIGGSEAEWQKALNGTLAGGKRNLNTVAIKKKRKQEHVEIPEEKKPHANKKVKKMTSLQKARDL